MKIKKILVPYDKSEFSKRSFDYSIDLATAIHLADPDKKQQPPITIILLHVLEELPITKSIFDIHISISQKKKEFIDGKGDTLSQHNLTLYEEMKKNIENSIMDMISSRNFKHGLKIQTVILSGNVSNQIIEYTKNNDVDLVIMGSNGLQGISRLKGLGSVSRRVSEGVNCPITIIR